MSHKKEIQLIEDASETVRTAFISLINAFVHKDSRITPSMVTTVHQAIGELKDHIRIDPKAGSIDQIIKKSMDKFDRTTLRLIDIAIAREELDKDVLIYDTFKAFRELIFLSSAVNFGVGLYALGLFDEPYVLLIGGVLGLILYYLPDSMNLIRIILHRKPVKEMTILIDDVTDLKSDISRTVRSYDFDEIEGRRVELEHIILSSKPKDTLQVEETIELREIYIWGVISELHRSSGRLSESELLKIRTIESTVSDLFTQMVQALVAVDANRPLEKLPRGLRQLKDHKGLSKFFGYVLINAISYTLLYDLFLTHPIMLLGLNITLAIVVDRSFRYLEDRIIGKLHKKIG